MVAELIRYGNSGKVAPPTVPPPIYTAEEIAAQERLNKVAAEKLALAGRAHWQLAHETRHWTRESFQAWRDGIPNFGCSCKRDADEYIAAHPPPLDSDEGMFVWLVDYHDHVNEKRGVPRFEIAAAREKYGR